MDVITINQAQKSDVGILTELLCELYETHSYEDLLAENKAHFDDRKQVFFLAFDSGKPIGACHGALRDEYVNGKEHGGTAGYLEAIYVRPNYRLRGAAARLVAECEDWARGNNCREFLSDCLLDNTDSYKFHLRLGFIETERCIFFRKELMP
jgi:aminoglycoside 6'-N-acetyltransferase I